VKLTGNITASMCTSYYVGCMNHESYTRCPVYIVMHYRHTGPSLQRLTVLTI